LKEVLDYSLEGQQNLILATRKSRMIIYFIDLSIRLLLYFFFFLYWLIYIPHQQFYSEILVDIVLPIFVWFAIKFLYPFLCEIFIKGKTIGNLVTNTRTVNLLGENMPWKTIFKRSLWRLIPLEEFFYFFLNYCLHDKNSNTKVIEN